MSVTEDRGSNEVGRRCLLGRFGAALAAAAALATQLGAREAVAATLYVDPTLSSAITDGTYNPATRANGGSSGNAYTSIKAALLDFKSGDTLLLRGDRNQPSHVYREGHITLWPKQNGTADAWSTIMSYPGEWAILDGENGGGTGGLDGRVVCEAEELILPSTNPVFTWCTLGYNVHNPPSGNLRYWRIERIEITGGGCANGSFAAGFSGTGGPFVFRYCYIHDNIATAGASNNPGGLTGHTWSDSLIELCRFERNGITVGYEENAAHVRIYSDYGWNTIAANGFVDRGPGYHIMRNEYRYNLFGEGSIGIKIKGAQLLSGRRPDLGHGYDDAFRTYGDRIHHNIFTSSLHQSVHNMQDFIQIHHNIMDRSPPSLGANDEFDYYKTAIYNNTLIGMEKGGLSWWHSQEPLSTEQSFYAMGVNNIFDGCGDEWMSDEMGVGWSPDWSSASLADLHTIFDRNYFYRPYKNGSDPQGVYVVLLGPFSAQSSRYTVERYEASFPGTDLFRNEYNDGDTLYLGTSGADAYRTRGAHVMETGTSPLSPKTIASEGLGGQHPYLQNVTLPSYVGATNPSDDQWVAGVLSLANAEALRSGAESQPAWVEGGAPASCGDRTCSGVEDCLNCPGDCGHCCGNGVCDLALGDNCDTCPADCPLGNGQICCSGELFTGNCCSVADCSADACAATHFCANHACTVMAGACCGDGVCETAFGEDCETCEGDCAPGATQICCRGGLYDGNCCESADCGDGKVCLDHACVAVGTCAPGEGQVCCRGGLYDGNCCESADCSDGKVCLDHACVAVGTCAPGEGQVCCRGGLYDGDCCENADCGAGLLCLDHVCRAPPANEVDTGGEVNGVSSCSGSATSLWQAALALLAVLGARAKYGRRPCQANHQHR